MRIQHRVRSSFLDCSFPCGLLLLAPHMRSLFWFVALTVVSSVGCAEEDPEVSGSARQHPERYRFGRK